MPSQKTDAAFVVLPDKKRTINFIVVYHAMNASHSNKKLQFIEKCLIDKNATRAAKAAGYSEKTAYSAGGRLLRNVEVAQAIKVGLKRQSEQAELKAIDVLTALKRIACGVGNLPSRYPLLHFPFLTHFEFVILKNGFTDHAHPWAFCFRHPGSQSGL